jgi:hypothetical protein
VPWRRIHCLIKHHTKKTYGGVEVYLHAFLTLGLDGDNWASSHPGHHIPGKRTSGPRAGLEAVMRKIPRLIVFILCYYMEVFTCMAYLTLFWYFIECISYMWNKYILYFNPLLSVEDSVWKNIFIHSHYFWIKRFCRPYIYFCMSRKAVLLVS